MNTIIADISLEPTVININIELIMKLNIFLFFVKYASRIKFVMIGIV